MSDVKSKNPYELLGNDPEEDSDREPSPPPKVKDKPVPRRGKREGGTDTAPSGSTGEGAGKTGGGRAPRRGGFTGSDEAFRDRDAGSINNRGKPTDDGLRQDRHSDRVGGGRIQGNYDGRGGRGGAGGRGGRGNRDDRHSRGLPNDHTKQADQSWGAPSGQAEWQDEKAGEAIASAEQAGGWDNTDAGPVDASDAAAADTTATDAATSPAAPEQPAAEPEPEDKSKSYEEYLAEQAEKKLQLNAKPLEARRPNEGSKQDKKWADAKPLQKEEDEYVSGKAGKPKRERERTQKGEKLDVDIRYAEPASRGGERGRGRGRGRGDRGGYRNDRGGRGRGDGYRGRDEGGYRGDGGYRGGRGGRETSVNVADENAFPSLGGS